MENYINTCVYWLSKKEKIETFNRHYNTMRLSNVLRKELNLPITNEILIQACDRAGFKMSPISMSNRSIFYINISSKNIEKSTVLCQRCNHSWTTKRRNKLPKYCASCNSPYWNSKKRVFKKMSEEVVI